MRKLIYEKMVSPDGFIEDKNGSTEWAIVDEELHLISTRKMLPKELTRLAAGFLKL